jgi:hypothetical protein
MVFERQRLLLTLLDAIGEPVGHTDFQKLLLLYTQACQVVPFYEFVPYRFGGFSFTSYADKRKLIAEGLLEEDDQNWKLTQAGRTMVRKQPVELLQVTRFSRQHAGLRGNALIVEQYRRYPYYATRSEILAKLPLEPKSKDRIAAARPKPRAPGLVTIGYEGRSLENYLNALLRAGVTVLADVRRNPLSRKYGFAKGTLSKASEGVGIRYEHLPELGIASAERKELVTQADYNELFAAYEHTTLPHQTAALDKIRSWITAGNCVALTCYERLPEQCHRTRVAKALDTRAQHL